MASLDTLSDGEIRSKLLDFGCEVGPVTPSTRKVYIKKLQNILEKGNSADGNSVEKPSSGPDDSVLKNRRKSPVENRTTRKSPARGSQVHPLASSTLMENASSPKVNVFKSTVLTDNRPSPSVTRDVTPPEKRVSSSTAFPTSSQDRPDFRSSYLPSYNGASKFNSPSYLNSGSPFKSDLSDFDSDQPYASDFTRRLYNTSINRMAAQTGPSARSPLLNSKIYDSVKESDDEEQENNGPLLSTKFGTSLLRGSREERGVGAGYPGAGRRSAWVSDASVYILGFLALFFLTVAYLYLHMRHDAPVAPYVPELLYPKCSGLNQNCIPDHEVSRATAVFKLVLAELTDMASKRPCSDMQVPSLCLEEASRVVNAKDSSLSVYELDTYVQYAGILANSNPSKNIMFSSVDGFKLRQVPSSAFCSFVNHTKSLTVWAVRIGICLVTVLSGYLLAKWWMRRKSKHMEEVLKMFSQIVEVVSSSAAHQSPGFAVISHVRDRLIPAVDKSSMMKIWDEAVALLEADSRVRTEVQQVEGEDFLVWRWLAPPPNPKKKMWQGQAFETMDGSVNSLPESPTSCLKIRHMFDPSQEEGDNWTMAVADAVLEKCKDAVIYHVVVDKGSPEGCVYVKCASSRDAGIAYSALHGFWFDSKLVTVKYIREGRYQERFPDSARAKYPLVPSSRHQT